MKFQTSEGGCPLSPVLGPLGPRQGSWEINQLSIFCPTKARLRFFSQGCKPRCWKSAYDTSGLQPDSHFMSAANSPLLKPDFPFSQLATLPVAPSLQSAKQNGTNKKSSRFSHLIGLWHLTKNQKKTTKLRIWSETSLGRVSEMVKPLFIMEI